VKQHEFLADCYKDGQLEFAKGKRYPVSERSAFYVATGRAKEVIIEEAPAASAEITPEIYADTAAEIKAGNIKLAYAANELDKRFKLVKADVRAELERRLVEPAGGQ
jgi:hypothetical protein